MTTSAVVASNVPARCDNAFASSSVRVNLGLSFMSLFLIQR